MAIVPPLMIRSPLESMASASAPVSGIRIRMSPPPIWTEGSRLLSFPLCPAFIPSLSALIMILPSSMLRIVVSIPSYASMENSPPSKRTFSSARTPSSSARIRKTPPEMRISPSDLIPSSPASIKTVPPEISALSLACIPSFPELIDKAPPRIFNTSLETMPCPLPLLTVKAPSPFMISVSRAKTAASMPSSSGSSNFPFDLIRFSLPSASSRVTELASFT